jgi:hypothetical protein
MRVFCADFMDYSSVVAAEEIPEVCSIANAYRL